MIKEYTIRIYHHPDDYQAVIELWKNSGDGIHLSRSDEIAEIEKKLLRDPDLFLVADIEGKIIGTVLGGFDGRRGMIYHLAVDRSFRELGIGSELTTQIESRLREKGCLISYLLVVEGNTAAEQFYENHGWGRMNIHIYGKDIQ